MVRVIPFLVVLAVAYWLTAPDPVTAGARTAAGTAVQAAGTGARSHWRAGRRGRELSRTDRRERWGGRRKGATPKTWQRRALKAEHGVVIAAKAVKGAAGLTVAAARPVPSAVRTGWVNGRDRHRARAGNRPVPIAVDPPWWHREQPQVQTGEQAPQQAQGGGLRCTWTVTPHSLSLVGVQKACGRPVTDGLFCSEHAARSLRTPCVTCGEMLGPNHACSPYGSGIGTASGQVREQPGNSLQVQAPEQVQAGGEQPEGTGALDTEEQIRARRGPTWNRLFPQPLTESDRRFWTERDAGYTGPLDQDGRPGDPDQWPFKTDPDPADIWRDPPVTGTTVCGAVAAYRAEEMDAATKAHARDGLLDAALPLWAGSPSGPPPADRCQWYSPTHGYCRAPGGPLCGEHSVQRYGTPPNPPAGTSPAGPTTPTPTEGAPVSPYATANVPSVELDDLDSLKRFAEYIASRGEDSEFMQIVERCKTLRESLREGGFGGHVDQAGASFEETAAALGQLGTEFCEEAAQMAQLAANVAGG